MMSFRIGSWHLWVFVCLLGSSQSFIQAQEVTRREAKLLTPGMAIERPLVVGEADAWQIELDRGDYLRVEVEQRGVDLVVALITPDDRVEIEVDSPTGRFGPETLVMVAEESGPYTIRITSFDAEGVTGSYRLFAERRLATDRDRRWAAVQSAQADAYRLVRQRTRDKVEQAIDGYGVVLQEWRALADRQQEVEVLHQLGVAHRVLGQGKEALAYFQQALDLHRRDQNVSGQARVLNQMGLVHWSLNDHRAARRDYSRALAFWGNLGEPSRQARVLNNLGLLHYEAGRYDEALAAYDRAYRLFHETDDKGREAITLNNIGLVLDLGGQPLAALEHYRQALDLARATGDLRRQAEALNSMGALYHRLGEEQEALDRYEAALTRFRELGDRRRQAAALANLGTLFFRLRDPQKALDSLSEALELQRQVGDRRGQAKSLNLVGRAHAALDQMPMALAMYRKALELRQEIGDRHGEAETLTDLGMLFSATGDMEEAAATLTRAVALTRELGDPVGQARALNAMGRVEMSRSGPTTGADMARARRRFREALRLSRSAGALFEEAASLRELAHAEIFRGDLQIALEHAEAALELTESLRTKIASDDLRTSLFTVLRQSYELTLDLTMQRYRRLGDETLLVQAFEIAERAKARSLLDLLREARLQWRLGVDSSLLEQERRLRQQLNAKASQRLRSTAGRKAISQLETEVSQLLAELQDVRARIRVRSPRYAALTEPKEVRLSEIQRHYLDEETLLLEFFLGERSSYLWAVTTTSIVGFELPARSVIEAAVRDVYEKSSVADPRAAASQRQALQHLGDLLLADLLSAPGKTLQRPRLAVVADGALHYVPFAALPVAGEPLVVRHELVHLPSAAVLGELRQPLADRPETVDSVVLFADPVFAVDDPRLPASAVSSDAVVATESARPSERAAAAQEAHYSRLPWTRREVQAIAEVLSEDLPGEALRVALDFDSSKEAVMDAELASYRVIHFATHGLLDSRHPELSGLVLSLVNEKAQPRDGFLRLHDIYNLNLGAELVILSGCKTALGREIRGEGLLSLARGFFYAGVPRVMASLWSVQDQATAELMTRFYRAFRNNGLSPAAALRTAQISMWRERRFRNPYYWAAFVLQGDWSAAEL